MEYGEISLKGDTWLVRCEPQVRSVLKRHFPKVPQNAADTIPISHTPANCRELEWFISRYPMKVKPARTLKASAAIHRENESRLHQLLAGHVQPLDLALRGEARSYQLVVPQVLAIKDGLLLADDLGIGKTVSAICCVLAPNRLMATVVVPPHLLDHWSRFFTDFAPQLDVMAVTKGGPEMLYVGGEELAPTGRAPSKRKRGRTTLPDVVVISYFKLRQWAEALAPLTKIAIFEECQQLRHPNTQIYDACELLARDAVALGLSATPIYNYGGEFFNVIEVLQPGALGTREEFVREWCIPGRDGKHRLADPEAFGAFLRREGIMLRRTRREVGRELPPVNRIVHTVDTNAEVFDKITGDAVDLAKIILRSNEQYKGEKFQASAEFDVIVRQATGIAKAPYVAEFVRLLLENGEKVLLFGWHRAVYDIWLERLKDFNPVLYTGTESRSAKARAEAAFKNGDSNLMIMSLRSGSGVDGLQHVCRTVVFGELDWSHGVHEQCIGRADRDADGSPIEREPVTAYFLVSESGADPVMTMVLGLKRDQIEGVRNPGSPMIEKIDTGENHLRMIAREFLARQGVALPADPPKAVAPQAAATKEPETTTTA